MPITSLPDSGPPETAFAVSWRLHASGAIITVFGELDMDTAPKLAAALAAAVAQDALATPVYVDLRGVTFLASAGWAVLLTGQHDCRLAGRQLVVVADQPRVLRVFRLTDLDTALTIRATLPERPFPSWIE